MKWPNKVCQASLPLLIALALYGLQPVSQGSATTGSAHPPGSHRSGAPIRPAEGASADFDTSMWKLPSMFRGDDLGAEFVRLVRRSAKDKFESTEHYQRRVDSLAATRRICAFWVDPENATFDYDADSEVVQVSVSVADMGDELMSPESPDYFSDARLALAVSSRLRSQSSYVGTNGFGAKATIIKRNFADLLLAPVNMSFGNGFGDNWYKFDFAMPPERARRNIQHMRVLAVCAVPRAADGGRLVCSSIVKKEPTFTDPTELSWTNGFVYCDLLSLWVCDRASGEVFLAYTFEQEAKRSGDDAESEGPGSSEHSK